MTFEGKAEDEGDSGVGLRENNETAVEDGDDADDEIEEEPPTKKRCRRSRGQAAKSATEESEMPPLKDWYRPQV